MNTVTIAMEGRSSPRYAYQYCMIALLVATTHHHYHHHYRDHYPMLPLPRLSSTGEKDKTALRVASLQSATRGWKGPIGPDPTHGAPLTTAGESIKTARACNLLVACP